MKRKETYRIRSVLGISCLLIILPCVGYGADLTIGNNVSTTGTISATSFTGNGSGLTNLDPAKLSSGTANINISGNAATVTNGLYSSGSYADPSWIISLSPGKLTSGTANINITGNAANATTAGTANSVAAGAVTNGGLANNAVNPQNIAFYSNVAIVAPILVSSGYNYFNNPAIAMSNYATWCGTPSATHPCLLKIMPGFYDITTPSTVQMQPYIDIEGSGELVTIISGTIDNPTTGVVNGAWGAEIRFLTVENRGGSGHTNAIALSNLDKAQTHITNVTVSASGGSYNYGIFNQGDINFYMPAPLMTNVTVFASDGANTYGIHNFMASPKMNNVTVKVSGGTDTNIGINNVPCVPYTILTNSTINASGGNTSYGIVNQAYSNQNAYLTMTNVAVTANATNSYGIYNNFAFPTMNSLTITASGTINSYGIDNIYSHPTLSTVTISASGGSQYNFAILNEQNSTVSLINVTSNATDGVDSFGVLNTNTGGNMTIDHCRLSGKRSIRNDNSSAHIYVGSSKLDGDVLGPLAVPGTFTCTGVYNANYSAITCP